jgi:hypothetical protein
MTRHHHALIRWSLRGHVKKNPYVGHCCANNLFGQILTCSVLLDCPGKKTLFPIIIILRPINH